jgi:hypothetical protein
MLNTYPLPSQELAKKYVNKIAEIFPNANLYILGHSKGGNLAAFASIYCKIEVKERIKQVYCFDSPGFNFKKINKEKYELVKERMTLVIPKSSVVGVLFEPLYGKRIICDSNTKGIRQHDAFSWMIENTKFVELNDLTINAIKFDKEVKKMVNSLTFQQCNELATNVYDFVIQLNKDTLIDLKKDNYTEDDFAEAIIVFINSIQNSICDYYKIHLDLGVWLYGTLGCFCIDDCKEYYVSK